MTLCQVARGNRAVVPLHHEGAVFCLASHEIETHWKDFAHHLERFCDETKEAQVDALREDLTSARKQFWGFDDGEKVSVVCLTSIEGAICWLWVGCGTESWKGQFERGIYEIERWAKSIGCNRLKIRGRVGWERKLAGFKRTAVIIEKEI